jgi:L-lactate dehydrogenase complex protein LldG
MVEQAHRNSGRCRQEGQYLTDPSTRRAAILGRIGPPVRSASEVLAEYSSLPRAYKRAGGLGMDARLELLEHRLREYDASVYRSARETLPQTIAQILTARGKSCLAVPRGFSSDWLPRGFQFTVADDLAAPKLDQLDGLISACSLAIATTGTLVLQNTPAQGPRKLSLVPDYHLCVVNTDQVVETVPEAFAVLEATSSLPTTFISGPSATADIEMTRIKGVHGPRDLDVVLIV